MLELYSLKILKPYRFRRNPTTVSISTHFNQIVEEASGEYFVLLADDDEISPNYVSELVSLLECNPHASVAIAKQQIMDQAGNIIRESKGSLPVILSGPEFIRAAWYRYEYGFECFATTLARTEEIKYCGGYPDFVSGTHNDDALLIKLCLSRYVVLSDRCTFRWRVYESSHGWSISIDALAQASRQFLQFLLTDPRIQEFATANRSEWQQLEGYLIKMTWQTYLRRWKSIYRNRLSCLKWVQAAFAMPFIASYYRTLGYVVMMGGLRRIKGLLQGNVRI